MFKQVLIIVLITFVGLVVFSYFNFQESAPTTDTNPTAQDAIIIVINNAEVEVTIADEPAEQAQGLSGIEYLGNNSGMLFVFDEPSIAGFWMKDMKFSLDLIWIDANGKIIKIDKNVSPDTYPKTFLPPSPVKYVLEVNAGWATSNKIKVGDKVFF